jgi:beta-glucosidase
MPMKIEDSPAHATKSFPGDKTATYLEGILVGYRWFDTKKIEPLYPFGFGLSYTNFALENAKTNKKSYTENEVISITVAVKNTGKVAGKEVVQVYTSKQNSKIDRAAQELKGFQKVMVAAGKSQTITIAVPVKELAYYNVETKKWTVEPGDYTLKIGNSSRDIKKEITITIQ